MSELERVRVAPVRCPYCHDDLERGSEPAVCPECHALHHDECLAEHGSCASCSAVHPRYAVGAVPRQSSEAQAKGGQRVRSQGTEPCFAYEAVDSRGRRKRGHVRAEDREAALEQVKDRGLFPTRILLVADETAELPPQSPFIAIVGVLGVLFLVIGLLVIVEILT